MKDRFPIISNFVFLEPTYIVRPDPYNPIIGALVFTAKEMDYYARLTTTGIELNVNLR